ncbi:MAG: hypothetical protein WAX33_03910 [Rectinemataceae bacterium]
MDSREKFLTVKTGGPSTSFSLPGMGELVPVRVAATQLGVAPATILFWVRQGKLSLVRLSARKSYVYVKEILCLLQHTYRPEAIEPDETTVEQ